MKKLFLIAALSLMTFAGSAFSVEKTTDVKKEIVTATLDHTFAFDSTGKTDVLLTDGLPTAPSTIICNTNHANPYGHAVVRTPDGKFYWVVWHTDRSMLPKAEGSFITQYTSAYGGTRYMTSIQVTQGQANIIC